MSALRDTFLKYLHSLASFGQSQTASINAPDLGYQWLVVIFVVVALIIGMFTLGRSRGVLMIIALYCAALIETQFSFYSYLQRAIHVSDTFLHIGLFVVLVIAIFLLLNGTHLKKRVSTSDSSSWSVFPLIILAIGFLASILLSFVDINYSARIPSLVHTIFVTPIARLAWTTLPLIGIFFLD